MKQCGVMSVGLDISKGRADVRAVLWPGNSDVGGLHVLDVREEREGLCQWIETLAKENGVERIEIGMEPTGGYEKHFKETLGIYKWTLETTVRCLPTTLVKAHQKAVNERTSTDGSCARTLAEALIRYPELNTSPLEGADRVLRRMVRKCDKERRALNALENELLETLHEAMPFLVAYASRCPVWILKLVARYPSARRLSRSRCLVKMPGPKEKLEEIHRHAKENVGSLAADELMEHYLGSMAESIMEKRRSNREQERALMSMAVKYVPRAIYDSLISIPDFADYTALVLCSELFLGGRRYATPSKLVKAVGLDLKEIQSGDRKGELGISKRGPALARKVLYLAAWRLVQHETVFRDFYQRQLKKNGGTANKALVAVMRKLVGVIWKLTVTGEKYDGEYEARWKEKHACAHKPSTAKTDLTKLIAESLSPELLEKAPVSKRFRKRVKMAAGRKSPFGETQSVTEPTLPSEVLYSP